MIEVTTGCQENTHNPNSDRMRSGYEAEETEEVKGEWGQQREQGGRSSVAPPWRSTAKSTTLGLDGRRTVSLSSI